MLRVDAARHDTEIIIRSHLGDVGVGDAVVGEDLLGGLAPHHDGVAAVVDLETRPRPPEVVLRRPDPHKHLDGVALGRHALACNGRQTANPLFSHLTTALHHYKTSFDMSIVVIHAVVSQKTKQYVYEV